MATKANGQAPVSRASAIRAARQASQAAAEIVFPLPATGGEALVRRLDLLELIALDAIPAGLQSVVNDMLSTQIGGGGEAPVLDDVLAAAGGPLAALRQQQQLADAACLAGFLDPRLVATPADVTDGEHELALEEIARADRLAYWTWCQGGEEAAALAPAFPEPAAAAVAGPAGGTLRSEPVGVPDEPAVAVRR
ncbi:MAG TPA: hypothetical protein VH475_22165 [Tepidisphaeraceae bacterium]|jgi:hypothetical protein